jgi:hypothetical protein
MRIRDRSATVQLSKVRMKEELRARLERDAEARGTTLNAALVDRLDKSFAYEDVFGTRDVSDITMLMAAVFSLAGRHAAETDGHPEWGPAQWRRDPHCYEQAALAVAEALWRQHPDSAGRWGLFRYWLSRLYGRVGAFYKKTPGDDVPPIEASMIDLVGITVQAEG